MNEENENKTDKKYTATLGKLAAIVNGKDNLKPVRKVKNTEISGLVEELFQEERNNLLEETKGKLKALLKQYHELIKSVNEKKKELEKLEQQKKEEFVKAAQNLFDKIENVDEIEKSYTSGIESVLESVK